ncbi:MAG: hypothetical protein MZU79_02030 [Anaerotruncus sp.]|nr:hypothetical protein [Anaerotruncus sp.]
MLVKYKFPFDTAEKQIVLEPKHLKYDANDVFISGYNPITSEKQLLHLRNVVDIKQLPLKSKFNYVQSPVIYKLKGRLAKGYSLYENEKIAGSDPEAETITIAAYMDDKDLLIKRLLKYGEYCEIIYPKYAKEKLVNAVNEALKNYEE